MKIYTIHEHLGFNLVFLFKKVLLFCSLSYFIVGCSSAKDGSLPGTVETPPAAPELAFSVADAIIAVNNSFTFTASGGTPPYSYSVASGGGLITTVADQGVFSAPSAAGISEIRLNDSNGAQATAKVTVNASLQIFPDTLVVAPVSIVPFTSSGGVGPNVYSVESGGGSINSVNGIYTASNSSGPAVIRITDSLGNISEATLTIGPVVEITPSTITLAINSSTLFAATGGLPPYAFSIFSGGGSIDGSSGNFTAPSAGGTVVVRVTDALNQTSDATITVNAALTISPVSKTLAVNNSHLFVASGGIAPYVFSIVSGGGSINSTTGAFTAPAVSGVVVVRVTDSTAHTADATVTVNPALAISPASVTMVMSGTQIFSSAGGVGPFSYSVQTGGGSIDAITGSFLAPALPGNSVVRVTDSLANFSDASITVASLVIISPATLVVSVNGASTFSASGGLAPYTYSIQSGGGTINSTSGAFTAPASAGSVIVKVTDALNQTSTSTVTVNPALLISPLTQTMVINSAKTFSASGGVSPYTFSVQSGSGSMNALTGVFTASSSPGTVVVRVTDSLLSFSDSSVTVNPLIAIAPTTFTLAVNNLKSFTASGGIPPYTFAIQSGGGAIHPVTGLFTAPTSSGSVVIRVTDFEGSQSTANVTVNPALAISPITLITSINNSSGFSASGGVPPISYSISVGGGTINSATGAFTAPAISGAVTVRATDSLANISESAVTVNGPLSISPTSLNLATNGVVIFAGGGGVQPYVFSIVSGAGVIDSVTGEYTAPSSSSAVTVRLTDSATQFVEATLNVFDVLTLSPLTVTLPVNSTQSFLATGGFGGRTFSVANGDGTIDAVTGLFTAGAGAGTTEIEVSDTIGNSLTAQITIVSNLSISPALLKLPVFSTAAFSATLGSAPYSYSVISGTGSVVAGTGVYTGGSGAGTDTVEVTDLGLNSATSSVTLIEPVEITAGSYHHCVRYNEGSVKCWGLNSSGQLGLGDTAARGDGANEGGSRLPFVNLGTGRTAKKIVAGFTHTCAILDNNTLKCWGLNSSGQLGLGDTATRGSAANQMGDSLPTINVGTGRTVKSVAAGASHTCAILDNDAMKCWGVNTYGQLGRDSTTTVGNTPGSMGDALVAINLGIGRTAKQTSAGLDHTCVILDDNNLKCFGRNNRGHLGKESITTLGDTAGEMAALTPINLGAGVTAVSVSAGYSNTCAILSTGNSVCWGLGTSGQLGRNNTTTLGDAAGEINTVMTTPIALGFSAISLHSSRQRSCALGALGEMKCWGLGTNGQLGQGSTAQLGDAAGEMAALVNINFGTGVTAAQTAVAWYSSCVITTNKRIKCFGNSGSGNLLNASTTAHIGDIPAEIGNGMPWVNH